MNWRESFLKVFGPGLLTGITFAQWCYLLRRGDLEFDLSRMPRLLSITAQSLKNSVWHRIEHARFDQNIGDVVIRPPLFVLGHWRHGTTLLHNLIAQDPQFAFPNNYQVSFPHTFLTTEAREAKWLWRLVPSKRPQDNMALRLEDPQEDEFALCAACLISPYLAWVFPRQKGAFAKYLSLRSASAPELTAWRQAFLQFLKKVQWLNGSKTLVLKSPPHTARIRLLLELFPDAKFVHIHRHPYSVFQSSQRTFRIMYDFDSVQRPTTDDFDDWILRQYREMYDVYFEEKSLIPAGRLHEIAFEELEANPVETIRRLYTGLDLPGFSTSENALQDYVKTLAGYQKNEFPTLGAEMRKRIYQDWRPCFDAWGYSS